MQSEYVTYFKKSIRSKQRDALVITVSETIKSELLGIGYSENQVQRCYPQTPFERPKKYVSRTTIKLQTDKCEIVLDPGEYVMSVGAMEPRKNILTLLRAYQGFRRQVRRTIPFVLISHHGWENEGLKQAIQDMDVERDIYIASHVDDALLASLYANCGACVSAAIYEGFGFVPLEALRYEAPLISGPTPSLLEGGFSNKRMIDQRDHEQFARALGDVFGGRDLFRADQGRFARPVIDYYLGQPRHRMGSLYGEALKGCAVN